MRSSCRSNRSSVKSVEKWFLQPTRQKKESLSLQSTCSYVEHREIETWGLFCAVIISSSTKQSPKAPSRAWHFHCSSDVTFKKQFLQALCIHINIYITYVPKVLLPDRSIPSIQFLWYFQSTHNVNRRVNYY